MPHSGLGRADDAAGLLAAVALGFQLGHPAEQLLQAHTHQVGQRIVRAARLGAANDIPWHTDDHTARPNLFDNNRIGSDAAVVADLDRAEHLGAGADDDPIANGGVAFADIPAGTAVRDAVIDRDVVTDLRGFPRSPHRQGWRWSMNRPVPSIAPGWISTPVRMRVSSANPSRGDLGATAPQRVADSMSPDGVHAGVGDDDLQRGRVGRIPLLGRPDVLPNRRQHG